MSGKWTPGPWMRFGNSGNGKPLIVTADGQDVLGYREPDYDTEGSFLIEHEDLVLMVAAPKLAEALAEVVRVLDSILPPIDEPDEVYHALKDALGDDYERLKGACVAGHTALEEVGWEG